MILIDSDSQNLIKLLDTMSKIPYVVQVRTWPVLRQILKDRLGEKAISLTCLVPHLTEADRFVHCMMFITEQDYEDLNQHENLMIKMKTIIDDYTFSNIYPKQSDEMVEGFK